MSMRLVDCEVQTEEFSLLLPESGSGNSTLKKGGKHQHSSASTKETFMRKGGKKCIYLLVVLTLIGGGGFVYLGFYCPDSVCFLRPQSLVRSGKTDTHRDPPTKQFQVIRDTLDQFHFRTDGVGQPLLNTARTAMGPSFDDVVGRDFQFDIEDHDVIVFLHIQKTGGTTFGKHLVGDLDLARQCECRRKVKKRCTCLRPGRNSFETWLFSRHSTGWKCGLHADWTELTSCVDDVMDKLEDNEIKRRYFYITMLRNPIHRFLSEFHHVRRGATWKNARLLCQGRHATKEEMPPCYHTETWENVTLDEFMACSSNLAINRQTRMLADLSLVGCYNSSMMTPEDRGKIMLLSAKNNLKKMAFYGLTEEQEISQYLFEVTFNLKFRVRFRQFNQTITDMAMRNFDAETIKQIEELNSLDMELYKYAVELLQQRFKKLSAQDKHFHEHFQNMGGVFSWAEIENEE
ncbi:hypothetical protein O3P69_013128 [Scylla paramamosain]|uniref:Heparan-sulfate 6-O-sulfotransferase n=1 Tax=Scylla paramamosain TaxID=85552 RepID=A0AAW0U1T9_SCYPA